MSKFRSIPRLSHHKGTGQAVARFGKRDRYFGRWGSAEAQAAYELFVAQWLAGGDTKPAAYTVSDLIAARWVWAERHYRHKDGSPTSELNHQRASLRPLRFLYGATPAAEFGPLRLKAVRARMVQDGLARKTVNQRTRRIVAAFKWGVEEELVPPAVWQALAAVRGLEAGRSEAKEMPEQRLITEEEIFAVLFFCPLAVRAMILVQKFTGMRPGEVTRLRPCDLFRDGAELVYRPIHHKNQYRGQSREIPLGPQARKLLASWISGESQKPCFGYTTWGYSGAVKKACAKAFPPPGELAWKKVPTRKPRCAAWRWETATEYKQRIGPEGLVKLAAWKREKWWHPHQLRHWFNTQARLKFGPDFAQAALGHASLQANAVYDHGRRLKAGRVMEAMG